MSPAQRHRAFHMAKKLAAAASPTEALRGPAASQAELQLARLGVDLRRLHEIQSVEKKIELKRELIPAYVPWIAGILDADSGAPDEILAQNMIWLFDVGEFDDALHLASYMLRHKLSLPERFKRTLGTFIVEEPADAAAKARGQAQDFDLGLLLRIEEMCAGEDMPDVVKAKLEKEIGLLMVRESEAIDPNADGPAGARKSGMERALGYLRRAYGHSHTAGVKKDIDRIERELRKLTTEAAAAELAGGGKEN